MKQKLADWIAWRLPKRVVYFAAIRLIAYATTGKYRNTIVPEITALDAVGRYGEQLEIGKPA